MSTYNIVTSMDIAPEYVLVSNLRKQLVRLNAYTFFDDDWCTFVLAKRE
jgi:hypothetical protein